MTTVQAPDVVTFLMPIGKKHATKVFAKNEDGEIENIDSYNKAYHFKGITQKVSDLDEFYQVLKEQQEYACFMVLGGIIEGTDTNKMRRLQRSDGDGEPTLEDRPVNIFCFDIDGYDGKASEFIRNELPEEFKTAECILQYSSSQGIKPGLHCHLFFWLKEPLMISRIREWVVNSNIKGLDAATCQVAQPIYTQSRICEDFDDPLVNKILYKSGGPLEWSPPKINKNTANANKAEKRKFVFADAVRKLLCAEDYHQSINQIALSLANDKVPAHKVKALLKAEMEQHPLQDKRWKERYDDIDRAVDSAFDIVNDMPIEDFNDWVLATDKDEVATSFAMKCVKFNPLDLTNAVNAVCQKTGYGVRDIRSMVKEAAAQHKAEMIRIAKEAKTAEREAAGIYELEYTAEDFGAICDRACKILAKSEKKPEVFVMGGLLASVKTMKPKTIRQCAKLANLKGDYPKMPCILQYKKPFSGLYRRMVKDLLFVDTKGDVVEPPVRVLQVIGEATDDVFKPLTGVIEHPYIDRNWDIIAKNGYDEETGLYAMLHRKLKITPMDPKEAFKYLTDVVFDEFPFGSKLDKAVAVAAMCTAVQRPMIAGDTGFPGFGIVSPTQSSGKTTLAQLISYSVYNRPVAAQSWTVDEEELGKHLLGILQEGHSCVLFDNIKQGSPVTSDRLATAMTNDMFTGRQLGENKTIHVPSSCLWMFTGNGIKFVGDFATRVYPINIVPLTANPEDRKFNRTNLNQWAIDNRKHTMSAILSIIKAGKNDIDIEGSTRFKEWDKFVRRPIFYASGIDINDAIKENQREDVEKQNKFLLINQLQEQFGNNKFTTKDVLKSAFGAFEAGTTPLGEVLSDILEKKCRSTTSVGMYLSTLVDNIFGDLVLTRYKSNLVKWQIVGVDERICK